MASRTLFNRLVLCSAIMLLGCSTDTGLLLDSNTPGTPPLLTGGNAYESYSDTQFNENLSRFPAFPGPGFTGLYASRFSSAAGSVEVDLSAPGSTGGQNTVAGTEDIVVMPGSDETLAWAVYNVDGFTADRPVELAIGADTPAELQDYPLRYWVAVANFTTGMWQWFCDTSVPESPQAFQGNTSIPLNALPSPDRYVSEMGEFHVAVICSPETSLASEANPEGITAARVLEIRIDALAVSDAGYLVTKPHIPILAGVLSGEDGGLPVNTLGWRHLADPASTTLEASTYQVLRQKAGETEKVLLGTVAAPTEMFTDPTDNQTSPPALEAGVEYTYFLSAENSTGSTPLTSRLPPPLNPPTDVQATIGKWNNRIDVFWYAADRAEEYELYRDDPTGEPFRVLSDSGTDAGNPEEPKLRTWSDVAGDFKPHQYWIKSVNEYETSPLSDPPALGQILSPPVVVLEIGEGQESGVAPHTVDFDASASHDPDDGYEPGEGITQYDWNFDGDFVYDVLDGGPIQQFTYENAGEYQVTLRIWDAELVTSLKHITITVTAP